MRSLAQTVALLTLSLSALGALVACNKIPESEESKKVGGIPKQTLDKAVTGVNQANEQAADRLKDAEKQK